MAPVHPSAILFEGEEVPPVLPVCDHYAGQEALIRKSLSLQGRMGPVFDVTADCEDGAEIGRELEHATMIGDLLASTENRFERMGARIHDPGGCIWHAELELIIRAAGARLAYVTIPKVERLEDVEKVLAAIDDMASQYGVRREIPVHVLIETHGALREVQALAAHPRIQCLSFGLMDYVSAFRGAVPASAMASPGQFEHPLICRAKAEISVAAHGRGKTPSHNVSVDITDPDAAGRDAARAAADYGFTRMWSIHPGQIAPIVAALSPPADEVALAAEILVAAQAAQWGPIRHAGRLQDRASYRHWWGLLRRAHAAGAALPDDARRAFFE
jgi:citrate lyase subunit beta/citryl-CoA lyase